MKTLLGKTISYPQLGRLVTILIFLLSYSSNRLMAQAVPNLDKQYVVTPPNECPNGNGIIDCTLRCSGNSCIPGGSGPLCQNSGDCQPRCNEAGNCIIGGNGSPCQVPNDCIKRCD